MSQLDPLTTTVGDLCNEALKDAGVLGPGQAPLAEQATDAWTRLQWMLQQWQNQRWLVYHLVDYALVCTGAQSYTFGPSGQLNTNSKPSYGLESVGLKFGGAGFAVNDTLALVSGPDGAGAVVGPTIKVTGVAAGVITTFVLLTPGQFVSPLPSTFTQGVTSGAGLGATFSIPVWTFLATRVTQENMISQRPDKLDSAFLRQLQNASPNQVDYPLQVLESREDYNRIRLKSLVSFPGAIFMDAGWPLSIVYPYPVPQGGGIYELHMTVKEQLPCRFATLATKVTLPMEYYEAVESNLALRLKARYQIPSFPGDPLPGIAKAALAVLRGSNTQVAELTIDPNLTRCGLYNIFSDTIY